MSRIVVLGDPPPYGIEQWLKQRQALGQDLFDEVWEGEYHVAPAARTGHGLVDRQVAAALQQPAEGAGLWPIGPFNLGDSDNYRVPDGAYVRANTDAVFAATAAIVVEIVSPGDETYEKFDFYFAHGVEELLVVDPRARTLAWYARGEAGFDPADGSALLGVTATSLADAIRWPPSI